MARAVTLSAIVLFLLAPPLPGQTMEKGTILEQMTCASDPTQSYSLYLPSYLTNDRKWPLLYVFDPRGRATLAAELFRPAAEKYGWILVSSNDTRSDGPPDPNVRALSALLPEMLRYPVDQRRVYMTGFSGGAMVAFLVAARNEGVFAGVIGCGGRFPDGWKKQPVSFAHWGSAGSSDFNYTEMRLIDEFLEKTGATHRFESFEGSHEWMPAALAEDAVAWMELDSMRRGLRTRDPEMIERLWQADVAAAKALETASEPAMLFRRWKNIEGTFRGLRDTSQASARAKELEGDKSVRTALRDEKTWDAYEERMLRQMVVAIAMLRQGEEPVATSRLVRELRIDELEARAKQGGYEALAAKRVLSSMYSQMSFYLYRDFVAARDFDRAAQVLEVAEILRPGSPVVPYNLACAFARAGNRKRALDALDSAVEAGFSDAKLMRDDEDLTSLRDEPRFRTLLGRVEQSAQRKAH